MPDLGNEKGVDLNLPQYKSQSKVQNHFKRQYNNQLKVQNQNNTNNRQSKVPNQHKRQRPTQLKVLNRFQHQRTTNQKFRTNI